MTGWAELTEDVEVVTFDVFDTLLHRKVRAPVDVFELVRLKAFESDFALQHQAFLDGYAAARRDAERAARRAREARSGDTEIRLDEIFAQMRDDHDLPDALVRFLKATELSLEDTLLFASPEGLERYTAARTAGRKLGFLSDMYLPSEWILGKLERAGFQGATELPLFVSGEHRVTKRSGQLYRLAAAAQDWPLSPAWLHVGDNRRADVEMADGLGLRTEFATWADVANTAQPEESTFGGNAVAAIAGFAECRPSRIFQPEGTLEQIGYRSFGPLLFGFTLWLAWQSRRLSLGKLLFIARDGRLPFRLFEMIRSSAGCDAVEAEYFYMSRQVGYLTGMREWDSEQTRRITIGRRPKSARRSFGAVGLDAVDHLEELARFGIEDIDRPVAPSESWRVAKALDAVHMEVLQKNASARADLQTYYQQALGDAKRVGFVDIGWVGNIQRLFANSLTEPGDRDRLIGLYLGMLPGAAFNEARGLQMEGFMTSGPERDRVQAALHAGGLQLLEFAMTADHGTTVGLERDSDGRIVAVLETPSREEVEYAGKAMRVQQGITRFVEEHLYLLDHFSPETLARQCWGEPLLRLVEHPTPEEARALAGLTHSDALGSNSERLPLVVPLTGWRRHLPSQRRQACTASYWKGGFDALCPAG
ncbi:hypothetical protein [Tropicimonas sp. IMCC6043]|uniref:hypothetical protein n=1 Tax=Tropicimonas sp. IMCC6043 TaxID=2510645 RepID=UPI00101CCFFB|nr:hypothetical protein [Tropicimonas sp. IMCC6043]RYH10980.1 hypothetical protein EU800_06960 [Tropicimonas sp. IMCC6043]